MFEDAIWGGELPLGGYIHGVPHKAGKPQKIIRFEIPTKKRPIIFTKHKISTVRSILYPSYSQVPNGMFQVAPWHQYRHLVHTNMNLALGAK